MMFVLIEIMFKYNKRLVTIPVIQDEGLFCMLNCLDNSDRVIAFKVIVDRSVHPNHFGYGPDWKKWVMIFTEEHFAG
jgi:hypothetical protein